MARKKYIEVEETSPFGAEVDERYLGTEARDASYLPGYSDKRMAREEAIRDGKPAPELDYRLEWVRAQRADGSRDGAKLSEWKAKGYQIISWEDAKAQGIRVDESAAQKGEDGNVYWGDSVLMIASKAVAAAHYWKQRRDTAGQPEKLVYQPIRDAHEEYAKRTGGRPEEPIFEIEHTAKKPPKKNK